MLKSKSNKARKADANTMILVMHWVPTFHYSGLFKSWEGSQKWIWSTELNHETIAYNQISEQNDNFYTII